MDRDEIIKSAVLQNKTATKNITTALKIYLSKNQDPANIITLFVTRKPKQQQTQGSSRKCTNVNCSGVQILSSICNSCAEGKAGYKTKWSCSTCHHVNLSKEDLSFWKPT